jgi:transcriptional regulator with XRE-family HTH domain
MASRHHPNYLRAHRKRLGLSQGEIAYLLGSPRGEKVCRYECFISEPGFRIALAYEIIFKTPAREIFPDLCKEIERQIADRARDLLKRLKTRSPHPLLSRKRDVLADIVQMYVKK